MEEASLGRDLVRLVSDFQNPLVVLCPLMVAELAPLRHGRADVPRLEVPERSDVSSVLRVLVTQEMRAPARVVALPAFPLRDRRDVDHRTLAAKFGDGNLLSQESACVLDPVLDRSAAHPIFHQASSVSWSSGIGKTRRSSSASGAPHASAAVLSPSGTRRYNRTAATRIGGTSTTVTGTWTSWPEVVEVGR